MKVVTTMLGGKRVGHFTGVQNLDTAATVQEAIDAGYVIGKKELVVTAVSGVVRSMVSSISRDGNGRKIDGVVSLQPSLRCKLADNCEPVSKDNVEAKLNVNVLKEGKIDTADWSFSVEGASSSMVIDTVTTGEVVDEVVVGEAIDFNGSELNVPEAATLDWTATAEGKEAVTGTIAASDRTCTPSRITTTANVLAALADGGWEGGTITFALKNGNKLAIKSATLRVAK